jgi:hypothetical protein
MIGLLLAALRGVIPFRTHPDRKCRPTCILVLRSGRVVLLGLRLLRERARAAVSVRKLGHSMTCSHRPYVHGIGRPTPRLPTTWSLADTRAASMPTSQRSSQRVGLSRVNASLASCLHQSTAVPRDRVTARTATPSQRQTRYGHGRFVVRPDRAVTNGQGADRATGDEPRLYASVLTSESPWGLSRRTCSLFFEDRR